jgi:hypothetical protein
MSDFHRQSEFEIVNAVLCKLDSARNWEILTTTLQNALEYRVIHERGTSEFLFCGNQQYNGSDY